MDRDELAAWLRELCGVRYGDVNPERVADVLLGGAERGDGLVLMVGEHPVDTLMDNSRPGWVSYGRS